MSWLRTDYRFGDPITTFTLGVREIAACTLRDDLANKGDDPDAVAKVVEELVRFYRPSLAGGFVYSLALRGGMTWEIGYAHPSLPRTAVYSESVRYPLVPEGWKKGEVDIDAPLVVGRFD